MKLHWILLIITPLLLACEKEDLSVWQEQELDRPLLLQGQLTKSSPEDEALLRSVGVYAFGTEASNAIVYENTEFSCLDGLLSPNNDIQYWEQAGECLAVHAYAPYNSTIIQPATDFSTAVLKLSVLGNQSSDGSYKDCDLLYGSQNGVTYTNWNDGSKDILFAHRLSKIEVHLKGDGSLTDTETNNVSVEIVNTRTDADLDLKTNVLEITSPATKDIIPNPIAAKNGFVKSMQAIILPQQLTASTAILKITRNSRTYLYKLENNFNFEKGNAYVFDVTLTRDEIILNVSEAAWGNGGSRSGEKIKYKVGDYFPIPNDPTSAVGVVFQITDGVGYAGKVVSLNETEKSWLDTSWILSDEPDCNSDTDGKNNVRKAILYAGVSNFSNRYPAFFWCYNYGTSWNEATIWYLPARNELKKLRSVYKSINSKISNAHGTTISGNPYYSSSEGWSLFRGAYTIDMSGSGNGTVRIKQNSFRVRAIRTFGD